MICRRVILFTLSILALFINDEGEATSPKKRVCVIGAGPAGLIAARILSTYPEEFDFIVYEKNSDVGGLWIYTDSTTVDEHGLPVHSSMYRDLRTSLPKQMMRYQDFTEIKGENRSFVKHETILQYLKNYTDYFSLRQHIQFNTNVEKVSLLPEQRWLLRVRDFTINNLDEMTCDAVMLANGHFVKGNVPKIPGIETFPGRVIHSHLYRKPEDFAGQTVVLLGASRSGQDIGIEISRLAKKVYLSSRHDKINAEFPPNLEQVVGVVGAKGSELILSDNSTIKADALVLCTGYLFDFPFLDATSGIRIIDGKYIKSLYKHLINVEHPTMAILTVPGFHFVISYAQTPYFLAVLRGNVTLPSHGEMLEDSRLPPGKSISRAHVLSPEELISYYAELATAGGSKPLPSYVASGYSVYLPDQNHDPLHFKKENLYIHENGHVEFH